MKKKFIAIIAALSVILCMGICAQAAQKEFGDTVNVVFLGGSITQGVGTTGDGLNYVQHVTNWMKETGFAEKTVNVANAGIPGTDSKYGFFRLESDVIANNPDIVFIEFSVNDHYNDRTNTNTAKRSEMKGYMESIIRRLAALDNAPAVIFVNTTDNSINTNAEVSFADVYAQLCTQYGIKAIDIESYVRDNNLVTASGVTGTILGDGTHPNNDGYEIYAGVIIDALENGTYYNVPSKDAQWISTEEYRREYSPREVSYSEMQFNGDWAENAAYKGSYTETLKMSENANDSVLIDFYGSVFCLGIRANQWGGNFRLEIDGEFIGNYNAYNAGTWPMEFPRGIVTGLDPDKKHTAKITVLGTHTSASQASNIIIARAFVADGEIDGAGKLVIKDGSLEDGIVNATVFNKKAEAISAKGLFAEYNESGVLTGCTNVEVSLDAKEYTSIGASVNDSANKIKLFIWEQDTLVPVCETIEAK